MPVTRIRSVERIHAQLRAAIMHGDFAPGAVLSQVQLARTHGVSRTPLREAIRRLEAEGAECFRPRRAERPLRRVPTAAPWAPVDGRSKRKR
jgi:DNA-binding GntR family transcriptional regulator